MEFEQKRLHSWKMGFFFIMIASICAISSGCQEVETLKKEVLRKVNPGVLNKKNPFVPRDGITIRTGPLYQTANPNSEVIKKLPAETSVHLMDKIGDYYRVRTRDGREGYLEQRIVGGEEIILRTQELRKSIEGMVSQADGITKTKANFRLYPGREREVIEVLPQGQKYEVFERVVTVRRDSSDKASAKGKTVGDRSAADESYSSDEYGEDAKKDVWYKVKMEDGRVGYLYTHNMKLSPPEDIGRAVPFMRLVAWRSVNMADDPDLGAKNNYVVAYAPIGKDAGCDFTRLYFMNWSPRLKRRTISWQLGVNGILPITNYHYEGKPGFSVRYLHPSKKEKLVLASFVLTKGSIKKVSEEEIPNPSEIH
jgi:hypothetical protein